FFIATLVIFAVMPLGVAIGFCDLFYALMAFPTMLTLILLRKQVRKVINPSTSFDSAHSMNRHDF
ncbi:MAG: hypothetical protein K2J28_00040, partial [Duncaniella sp.]|nr:hypothetical protein [Duncaniella sp.]